MYRCNKVTEKHDWMNTHACTYLTSLEIYIIIFHNLSEILTRTPDRSVDIFYDCDCETSGRKCREPGGKHQWKTGKKLQLVKVETTPSNSCHSGPGSTPAEKTRPLVDCCLFKRDLWEGRDLNNSPIKLDSDHAIQLQEQIKNVIRSEPILDQLVALIADAIVGQVTQHVYSSINHDLETKTEKIKVLEKQIKKFEKELDCIKYAQEEQEQYSRRSCLLVHGVPEQTEENTDDVALKLFKSKPELNIKETDIDRSHRITSKRHSSDNDTNPQPRALIVKFARYNIRQKVYAPKIKLKKTSIFIREHLTSARQGLTWETLKCTSISKAWTNDGRIRTLTKSCPSEVWKMLRKVHADYRSKPQVESCQINGYCLLLRLKAEGLLNNVKWVMNDSSIKFGNFSFLALTCIWEYCAFKHNISITNWVSM